MDGEQRTKTLKRKESNSIKDKRLFQWKSPQSNHEMDPIIWTSYFCRACFRLIYSYICFFFSGMHEIMTDTQEKKLKIKIDPTCLICNWKIPLKWV